MKCIKLGQVMPQWRLLPSGLQALWSLKKYGNSVLYDSLLVSPCNLFHGVSLFLHLTRDTGIVGAADGAV